MSILVWKKSRKLWVLYIQFKNKLVNMFLIWLSKIENKSGEIIKALCADKKGEFIFIKLKNFCKKRSIVVKFTTSYIYEKNGLVKRD